ncbi:hypothetical protein EFA46_013370 (plasmid) [Halarchaeum sp. CBA1220]|uniref:hypothetical protein n=1 Tax=Halarchaeum sp. CBA1220 TaxID=1853682 RepID=UPI000F3A9727|nr:hypothetical protein [Halarchaeum sp. CBA1220]QLC35254.1 hypothetical protein EFA46_013370 [Halarchaeum sp. CBA1220]
MPPRTPEEVVAITDSHLDYITSTNARLQQYKGRTQAVLSMLDTLQHDTGETEAETSDIEETREAAQTLQDQLEYWIEATEELQEIVRSSNSVVRVAQGMTSSLTDIDEDMPERVAKLEEKFEGYRDATDSVNDNIEIGVELLERLVILLIDAPESAEIAEISARIADHHRTIKERLDID